MQQSLAGQVRSLFGAERGVPIEAHGAQRWDVAGGERDGGKHKGNGHEVGRSVGDTP